MPEIDILIKATDQASAPIKKVEGEVKNLGESAKSSSSGIGNLGNVLKTGLMTAAVGAAAAVGGLIFAFKDSLTEARNQIQADKQLEAVIKSTGGAAGVTAKQAQELAGALSQVTNFGDDAIESGESLLLTFTNIGKDVFPAATETMLDMSQALGQDMKSSAVQLGKALNDPITGITALSRVGVTFNDTQKEMIKNMVDAGNTAGAQAVILQELQKEFGGSAKALADPLTQLSNAWGEVQESVGMLLIPVLNNLAQTILPHVQAAAQAVSEYVSGDVPLAFEDGSGAIADFFAALGVSDEQAQLFGQNFYDLRASLKGTWNTITGDVQNAIGWIRLAWDTDWGKIHTTFTETTGALSTEQETFWIEWHKTFSSNSKQNVNDWEGFFGSLSSYTGNFFVFALAQFTEGLKLLRGIKTLYEGLMTGDWKLFWEGLKQTVFSITDIILNDIEYIFGPGLRNAIATSLNDIWNVLKSWWTNVSTWWNATVAPLFGTLGAVPGMPQLPGYIPAPPVPGQDNLSGGNNAQANTSSMGGVAITQHFYGPADAQTVQEAATTGVRAAARSLGMA